MKVKRFVKAANARGLPVYVHRRGQGLGSNIPSAHAALSWLYSQIISENDLDNYPRGILNMHGGKIPEYRGASTLQWAIINGEDEIGITWHKIVGEVDAGPIWAESTIPIPPGATAEEMRKAMILEGLRLFPRAWARFCNPSAVPRYPELGKGHVWRQRKPEDGKIKRGWSARQLQDMVRALCPPWPAAYLQTAQGKLLIEKVIEAYEPGCVTYHTGDKKTIYLRPISEASTH